MSGDIRTVNDELDEAGALLVRLEHELSTVKAKHADELQPYKQRIKAVREHVASLFAESGNQGVLPLPR